MTKTRTILLVLAALFLMSTSVSAQSTWLPTFSTSQKVYVAPGVDNGVASQFQSADFKAELDKVAAAQKLDVYVIVTKTGSDVSADNSAGPPLVRKVWDNWTSSSGFPRQRALVILMTGDGRSFQSVGVRAGESLNRLGIVRDTMSSDTGPVRPVLRANLASNPVVVPIRIAENINGIVAAKQAAQTPSTSGRSSSPTTSNPTTTSSGGSSLGIVLFALGVGFCIFIVGYAITRSNARNYDRHVGSPYTRTTGSGFQQRMNASRRDRTTTTGADTDNDDGRRNDNDGNSAAKTALAAGAGAVGGYILADQVHKRDLRKKDDTGSGTTDSGSSYVAPACSTPSTPSAPSCSSPSCSSGSSCGGGGGCGGGGCGGG